MTLFKTRPAIVWSEAKRLEAETYPILIAPWHDTETAIQVRILGDSARLACGDFGLIQTFESKLLAKREPTIEEMNAFAEYHHEICQKTMVDPTYDEMMKIAGAHIDMKEVNARLKEIKDIWAQMEPGPDRIALKKEYDALELTSKFLLPANFTAFVVHYALQVDKSDLDDMTEKVMKHCAVLATRGGDNPHDHFKGRMTPRVELEFDNRAWVLLDAYMKMKPNEQKAWDASH
jgi:hypothetical protein